MGGAAILQTDAVVCDGIAEWRRDAQMSAAYGINVMPHAFHDLHTPLVASMPNAPYANTVMSIVCAARVPLDRVTSFSNRTISDRVRPASFWMRPSTFARNSHKKAVGTASLSRHVSSNELFFIVSRSTQPD